ncbi:1-acylglycerol-3-phosphate O-acyltransferase [Thalassotalea castellviae]|uniref:1-acyl-sn-glycerol-3-phosphate acyltransferase n=1 Tax=Thalassotalea castellviae TaxID=3075612 RepID=A0ABU2ZZK8_9GAMM|nr:1-acylglycerol-3-phosphate O-acyltransferase [Thalassotalea sp. W431]MDT0603135.1 1-acylglycerol-3-phosphate O-acyltransferase [Thalassotalea sp. W431]
MLALIRIILMTAALVIICIFSCLYCLLRPFHPNNVYITAKVLGKVTKIFGLDVEVRVPDSVRKISPAVYICNHQNSYDIFTAANAVLPNTVSVGKKSLKWIPFFGQMYWLTGNILIDRKNTNKAMNTIALTAKKIREKNLSVWLFPEGTRSNGKGILSFKTGAFRTAMQANVPVIPICVSNMHNKVDLNRWDNGKIIIEYMEPISLEGITKDNIRTVANSTRDKMIAQFERLNKEAEQ